MHALIEVLSGASPKHSPHPAMCFPEQLLVYYLQLCSSGFKTLQWRKWDLLCEMRTNCGPFQQFGPHADQVRNCGPLRSHCIGRWGAWTWDGGGTTSEVLGSWKVRFNFAWPPGSDSRQKLACRPLFPEVCHMGELVEGDHVTLRRKVVWGSWWKLLSVSWMSNEHGREAVRLQRLGEVGMWGSSRRAFSRKLAWRPCFQKKICYMGELVVGESMGGGGPRSLGDHGSWSTCSCRLPPHILQACPLHNPCNTPYCVPCQCAQFCKQAHFFKYEHFFNKNTSKIRRKYEQNRTNLRAKLKFLF